MISGLVRKSAAVAVVLAALAAGGEARAEVPRQTKVNIAWQIALDAAGFSAGIIDGQWGRKGKMAMEEYARRHFPTLTTPYDQKVLAALQVDVENALTKYTVTADDAAQVGGKLPEDWNLKAYPRMKRMAYESMADALTEKFHCTRALLQTLNPGVALDALKAGDVIQVPNIRPFPTSWEVKVPPAVTEASEVRVNLGEKTVRVYDAEGRQLALFHCSVAKDKEKLPARDAKITAIVPNPNYTFNPKYWPEVRNVDKVLIIPPGPRNPVGVMWIQLDLPGYGMHGNPKPELIGKTGSHGCFRLTNWDAVRYASYVRVGMTVKMIQ